MTLPCAAIPHPLDRTAPEGSFNKSRAADGVKRCVDIMGAAVLLLALLPLMAAIALGIRLHSPGPVLFAHARLGLHGRRFHCLKFRTMFAGAEDRVRENAPLRRAYIRGHYKIAARHDPRVTPVGAMLRRTSLDELPQLWNVIRGDMSLVGPRPIVDEEALHYGAALDEMLSVRPGITGRWAVEGRNAIGYPMRTVVELSYVRRRSLGLDLAILARTPWVVVTQRGVI